MAETPKEVWSLRQIVDVVAQFPHGATAHDVAARRWSAPEPKQRRGMAAILGVLVARGQLRRHGRLHFVVQPRSAAERAAERLALPPPGWYATPAGPRYWNGAKWA